MDDGRAGEKTKKADEKWKEKKEKDKSIKLKRKQKGNAVLVGMHTGECQLANNCRMDS